MVATPDRRAASGYPLRSEGRHGLKRRPSLPKRRTAEPDALLPADGEGILCSLPDNPPFPLSRRSHHRGEELSGRGGEVDTEIERDDIEAGLLRLGQETGEVHERAAEAVELRNNDPGHLA